MSCNFFFSGMFLPEVIETPMFKFLNVSKFFNPEVIFSLIHFYFKIFLPKEPMFK